MRGKGCADLKKKKKKKDLIDHIWKEWIVLDWWGWVFFMEVFQMEKNSYLWLQFYI